MKKEFILFLIAGCSAVLTDVTVYYLLIHVLNHNFSKGISFVCGSMIAFLLNKFFTFKKNRLSMKEILTFCILYLSTLVINIFVNGFVLSFEPNYLFFAFLIATGVSTILNYIGQKFWVFK
jgi:putative flippase GtrA